MATEAHRRSRRFVADPTYSAERLSPPSHHDCGIDVTNESDDARYWLYGEAELECYRLSELRRNALSSGLNVHYPGNFREACRRGTFRYRARPAEGDSGGGRAYGTVLLRSNGNARVSVRGCGTVAETDREGGSRDSIVDGSYFSPGKEVRIDVVSVAGEDEGPPCICVVAPPGHTLSSTRANAVSAEKGWEFCSDDATWSPCRAFLERKGEGDDGNDPPHYPHLDDGEADVMLQPRVQTDQGLHDFGIEVFGHVILECRVGDPSHSPFLYVGESESEALNNDPRYHEQSTEMERINSSMEGGRERYEWRSLHPLAFRYVRIEGIDTIAKVEAHARFLPVRYKGAFSSSDEVLTRIWTTAAYTLRLCLRGALHVDGCKRDQLPWAGDLAVSLVANAYSFADPEPIRRTLTALGRAGIDKTDVNGICDYSLWWIVAQDLYQTYFGDASHLRREWGQIQAALKCLADRTDGDGFLCVQEGSWLFIDWGLDDVAKATALQILWWWTLECGASLAKRMDDRNTESKLERHREVLRIKLLASCWDESANLWRSFPGAPPGDYSRHANVLAVVSGLTPPGRTVRIFEALLGDDLPSLRTPYMKSFECLALSRIGSDRSGLAVMRRYWGGMINKGATTFWESFDANEEAGKITSMYDRPFGRSLCHAWSSGPCQLLPEMVLGIRPLEDGWKVWTCEPQLNDSDWACATVPTPQGILEVNAMQDKLCFTLPEGTTLVMNGDSYLGPRTFSLSRKIADNAAHIDSEILRDWSAPYRGWHYHPNHVIPSNPQIKGYGSIHMTDVPTVFQLHGDSKWYMTFIGFDGKGYQSFVAESADLVHWTNMRLAIGFGDEGDFDFGGRVLGAYVYEDYDIKSPRLLKRREGKYFGLYGAYAKQGGYEIEPGCEGLASSENGLLWQRAKEEPVLSVHDKQAGEWEMGSIYQPWVVEKDGLFYNFYNAKKKSDSGHIEQIGLATSSNLRTWQRHAKNPVLHIRPGGFDADFTADPKVFWDRDHWVMFYFGVGCDGAHIMIAFSRDLRRWTSDPEPLYKAGGNPSGLDKQYAHKTSLVWNPSNKTYYMFYNAVGDMGRGIGLITSKRI